MWGYALLRCEPIPYTLVREDHGNNTAAGAAYSDVLTQLNNEPFPMSNDLLAPDDLMDALLDDFPPVPTEAWHDKIMHDLKGADYERRLVWKPLEGFAVQPFYRAEERASLMPSPRRGAAGNDWHIRQDIAVFDPAAANQEACQALARGATAIGFDLGALPEAFGQADVERLLDGVSLETTPLHWISPDAAPSLLAMLLHEAERQGVAPAALHGSLPIDPFTGLMTQGTSPVYHVFDEAARLLGEVDAAGAALQTLCIDAQPFHMAGASSVQELAFTLAAASESLAQFTERGVSADAAVPRLRLAVPVGTSYFMEIAKLRALRLLLGQLVRAYGADGVQALPAIEAVTSRWSLTRYDQHSNLLRATSQAAAAVIGGCNTLTIHPFDAASGTPTDTALRLARNIQLILKQEAHLDAVADPAAGSYYIETLTDALGRHAWSLFQRVEAQGGLLKALEQGFIQQELQATREKRDQEVASGKRVFVGTNAFPDLDETLASEASQETPTAHRFTPATAESVLEIEPLPGARGAEAFEALRLRTERHARQTGRRPAVFLLPIGKPAMANARATFSRNFFGCAGFSLIEKPTMGSIEEGAQAVLESDAEIVVLCSSDPEYATFGPALSALLNAAEARPLLVVAGFPKDLIDDLKAAGVDDFIHRKQNLLETLTQFQEKLGIVG